MNYTIYVDAALILSNLGLIVTIAVWGGKAIWWASKVDAEIMRLTKETDAAHKNIRELAKRKNNP